MGTVAYITEKLKITDKAKEWINSQMSGPSGEPPQKKARTSKSDKLKGKELTILGTKFNKEGLTVEKAREAIEENGGKWVQPSEYEMVTGVVIKLGDAEEEEVNNAEGIDEIN